VDIVDVVDSPVGVCSVHFLAKRSAPGVPARSRRSRRSRRSYLGVLGARSVENACSSHGLAN
jgi:hypothetical protein